MKKVLVLGAGMVARPLVRYLLAREGVAVTVADVDQGRATALVAGAANGRGLALDARDLAAVGALLDGCDLLVSLLPPEFEPPVTRLAIEKRRSMVSASPRGQAAMDVLDGAAREAGVTLLPEVGLDPGLDHMAIARMVTRVKARGGTVVSCRSCCGGLPAPEANTNRWGYKFSWNPKGAVQATLLDAWFVRDGREVSVPNDELFTNHWLVRVPGFDELEAHYNGDSRPYVGIYGIEGAREMVRATLRYPGWAFTISKVQQLGYNATTPLADPSVTYAALTRRLAGLPEPGSSGTAAADDDLVAALARVLDVDPQAPVLDRLVWLGITADEPIRWTPGEARTPLMALAGLMYEKMVFAPGERDLSVLHNEIVAEYPGAPRERSTATLIAYGEPQGDSSMALTVGLPAAVAATLLLDGRIPDKGLVLPVIPSIFDPILDEIATLGVEFEERTEQIASGDEVTSPAAG